MTVGVIGINGQERPPSTCSCGMASSGCSASQSCPDTHTAVCSCSAAGCTTQCSSVLNVASPGEINVQEVKAALAKNDAKALSTTLSRSYGKFINFSPSDKLSRIALPRLISNSPVDWTLLEFFDKNGKLIVNGQPLAFWKGLRQTMLNGGAYQICSDRADAVINEISFVSGRSFAVVAGDTHAKLTAPVKGNGLNELLLNLSQAANIRIEEN